MSFRSYHGSGYDYGDNYYTEDDESLEYGPYPEAYYEQEDYPEYGPHHEAYYEDDGYPEYGLHHEVYSEDEEYHEHGPHPQAYYEDDEYLEYGPHPEAYYGQEGTAYEEDSGIPPPVPEPGPGEVATLPEVWSRDARRTQQDLEARPDEELSDEERAWLYKRQSLVAACQIVQTMDAEPFELEQPTD
ncbi:hypothetical protein G7054_g5131 [Neopestalotiopsis clavispora]|nr:hypothetical protein G7054_g5131 [Neopestalotiopsis clavispora]